MAEYKGASGASSEEQKSYFKMLRGEELTQRDIKNIKKLESEKGQTKIDFDSNPYDVAPF